MGGELALWDSWGTQRRHRLGGLLGVMTGIRAHCSAVRTAAASGFHQAGEHCTVPFEAVGADLGRTVMSHTHPSISSEFWWAALLHEAWKLCRLTTHWQQMTHGPTAPLLRHAVPCQACKA